LLFNGDAKGNEPVCATFKMIAILHGIVMMALLFEITSFAIVCGSDGMEFMCPTITFHVTKLDHLSVLFFHGPWLHL
jgi:hypothetical protein